MSHYQIITVVISIFAIFVAGVTLLVTIVNSYFQYFHKPNRLMAVVYQIITKIEHGSSSLNIEIPITFINNGKLCNSIQYTAIKNITVDAINTSTVSIESETVSTDKKPMGIFTLHPEKIHTETIYTLGTFSSIHLGLWKKLTMTLEFVVVTSKGKRIKLEYLLKKEREVIYNGQVEEVTEKTPTYNEFNLLKNEVMVSLRG